MNRISTFPIFEPLSLEHRSYIENYTNNFPPYSDFNFWSLYSWNIDESAQVSNLNGNLVIRFKHYNYDRNLYTYLGNNQSIETTYRLLEISPELEIIPEHSLINEHFNLKNIKVTEDRDSHDYIISLKDLSELKGNKFKSKRQGVNKIVKNNPNLKVEEIFTTNKKHYEEILMILNSWKNEKSRLHKKLDDDYEAILRLVQVKSLNNFYNLGLYNEGKMIGFTINELPKHSKTVMGHYGKVLPEYKGMGIYIEHMGAKDLLNKGFELINIEQDLGIEGMRESKMSYRPVYQLKKYKISK